MASTRAKNLAVLKALNLMVCKLDGKSLSENELMSCVAKAEGDAVKLYIMARKHSQSSSVKSRSNVKPAKRKSPAKSTNTLLKPSSTRPSHSAAQSLATAKTSIPTSKNVILSAPSALQSAAQPSATAKINANKDSTNALIQSQQTSAQSSTSKMIISAESAINSGTAGNKLSALKSSGENSLSQLPYQPTPQANRQPTEPLPMNSKDLTHESFKAWTNPTSHCDGSLQSLSGQVFQPMNQTTSTPRKTITTYGPGMAPSESTHHSLQSSSNPLQK